MTTPRPESARFTSKATRARPPSPPFGLPGWSDDGAAVVVQLDASAGDLSRADAVASQLPDSGAFAKRTLVVVLGAPARSGGAWRRMLLLHRASVPVASRCSALLMRGYVDIGSARDDGASEELAWGWSQ